MSEIEDLKNEIICLNRQLGNANFLLGKSRIDRDTANDKYLRHAETIERLKKDITELKKSKNMGYWERNQLVAYLAKLYPSSLERHEESEEGWKWVVYIDIPGGQASWHLHDSELKYFKIPRKQGRKWDGSHYKKYEMLLDHDTSTIYELGYYATYDYSPEWFNDGFFRTKEAAEKALNRRKARSITACKEYPDYETLIKTFLGEKVLNWYKERTHLTIDIITHAENMSGQWIDEKMSKTAEDDFNLRFHHGSEDLQIKEVTIH